MRCGVRDPATVTPASRISARRALISSGSVSYTHLDVYKRQRVGHVVIPPERALDIDTYYDIHLAGLLLSHPFDPAGKGQP